MSKFQSEYKHSTCFAALLVSLPGIDDGPCITRGHITIGVNKAADHLEVAEMKQELDELIVPLLPFEVRVTGESLVGVCSAKERPALACEALDPIVGVILNGFYKRHSRLKNGRRLRFPDLAMHVTLNDCNSSPETGGGVPRLMKAGTVLTIEKTLFESRNDEADASTRFTDKDWTCLRCATRNKIHARQCTGSVRGVQCEQWRPRAAMAHVNKKREGDWHCCGEDQYATRVVCRKCGKVNDTSACGGGGGISSRINKKRSVCP